MFFSSRLVLSVLALGSAVYATPIENKAADVAADAAAATPPPGYNSIFRCELMRQGSDRQRECYLSAYGNRGGPTPTVVVYPNTIPMPRETVVYDGGYPPRETIVYNDTPRPRETVVYGDRPRDPYENNQATIVVYQPTRPSQAIQATVYQSGNTIGQPNWN